MAYSIVSALCIAGMVGILVYLIVKFFLLGRAGKIEFIKSFKKGKCVAIYCIAMPLYFMAAIYSGKTVVRSIFEAIYKSAYLIVLKYDCSAALIDDNAVFAVALYMCFALVFINAFMFVISLLHKQIWKSRCLSEFRRAVGDKCIIVGNSATGRQIYSSCGCGKALVDIMSGEDCDKLCAEGITYHDFSGEARFRSRMDGAIKELLKSVKKSKNKINVIISAADERENLNFSSMFLGFIGTLSDDDISHIDVYVFGKREHEGVYEAYEAKSRGCLHYIDEYTQLAVDFISKYPLTQYMDERQIDYSTALIRPDVDINVAMIGFGGTNRQLFYSMLANNQFLTADEKGNIVCKQVIYHLFDRRHTEDGARYSDDYFRFGHDYNMDGGLKDNAEKYLSFPEAPERHFYHRLDLGDIRFYDELKGALSFRKNSVNAIIVALGDDYLNIDIGKRIAAKADEWRCEGCKVFVRIRDKKIFKDAGIFFGTGRCIAFGDEEDSIYNYSNIIREQFNEMAIMRNCIYDIEHDMRRDGITEKERAKSRLKWYTERSALERWSNIYACLSLKSKLQLMGLDCRQKDDGEDEGISYEEYMSVYAVGDEPKIEKDKDGKIGIKYTLDFPASKRRNLAVHEHNRWNAYMLMKGFVPATREQIVNEKKHGKNYVTRRHGNLTTFDGLVEFRKMVSEAEKCSEENVDVIKYDYQLLDGAWWLLTQNGFKIVRR